MRVAQIGNFRPPHSTENDLRRALLNNGHQVVAYQEGEATELLSLIDLLTHGERAERSTKPQHAILPDFIMWTRTRDLATKIGNAGWWELIARARQARVPIVGYHLDRWWGLKRQDEVHSDPFFHVDILFTADGAHQDEWEALGIHHVWMLPAISEDSCGLGTPRDEFTSDIAFVGSWQGYHPEWRHRMELVNWLQHTYGKRVRFWPKQGEPAVRGDDLKDLYASVKVVVGDSCLVRKTNGEPMTNYCSDRIPETLGRGGVLVHPHVEGVTDLYGHLSWDLGDWTMLRTIIEMTLTANGFENDGLLARRIEAIDHIREHHTYEVRVREMVDYIMSPADWLRP